MMVHEQERVVFMREVAHSLPRRDDSGGLRSKSEPVRLEDRRIPTAHSTTQQQQQQQPTNQPPTENPISPPPMMCIRSGRL